MAGPVVEMNQEDDILACRDAIVIKCQPEQEIAVVEREFASRYAHELREVWNLVDPLGKVHLVSFEKNADQPYLFKGLLDIRKYYSLEGLNWCLLKYQGYSNFDLFIYTESIEEVCYLHSPALSTTTPPPSVAMADVLSHVECTTHKMPLPSNWICYPCFFTCKLTASQASGSQLNLPVHVYEYLRSGKVLKWVLRGPSGLKVDCAILGVPHRKYAKLGRGWRAFCTGHGLETGDVLSFFFTCEMFAVIDVLIHAKP